MHLLLLCMYLSKPKCQPAFLTGYVLSFKTYTEHLNHLNFKTENAKIGSHMLTTLNKQKMISIKSSTLANVFNSLSLSDRAQKPPTVRVEN